VNRKQGLSNGSINDSSQYFAGQYFQSNKGLDSYLILKGSEWFGLIFWDI